MCKQSELTFCKFVERRNEVVVRDDRQPHEHVDRHQDVDDQASLQTECVFPVIHCQKLRSKRPSFIVHYLLPRRLPHQRLGKLFHGRGHALHDGARLVLLGLVGSGGLGGRVEYCALQGEEQGPT